MRKIYQEPELSLIYVFADVLETSNAGMNNGWLNDDNQHDDDIF